MSMIKIFKASQYVIQKGNYMGRKNDQKKLAV